MESTLQVFGLPISIQPVSHLSEAGILVARSSYVRPLCMGVLGQRAPSIAVTVRFSLGVLIKTLTLSHLLIHTTIQIFISSHRKGSELFFTGGMAIHTLKHMYPNQARV